MIADSPGASGATETLHTRSWLVREWLPRTLWTLLAGLGSLVFVTPLVWMITTSIKPRWEQMVMPPKWIPSTIVWANYIEPWLDRPFPLWYRNTLILVGCNVIAAILSSSLVAYGFARVQFRGRNVLFLILLSTMMLPGQVTVIPIYYLFSRIGWVDSLKPLIIPNFFAAPFYVFLLRQFFMTISPELDNAAEIDGCGVFGVYWRIILPLSRPALAVVAIDQFTWSWNDFFGPLIYVNTPIRFPVALGLRFFQGRWDPQIGQTMAMTFVSVIPVLLVFYFAQRSFIQGIVITGVKG